MLGRSCLSLSARQRPALDIGGKITCYAALRWSAVDLEPGLDPPTTSRCDGGSHDRGLRNGRGPRRDGLGDDCRLGHRVADDTDPSYACWPERHVSLLRP